MKRVFSLEQVNGFWIIDSKLEYKDLQDNYFIQDKKIELLSGKKFKVLYNDTIQAFKDGKYLEYDRKLERINEFTFDSVSVVYKKGEQNYIVKSKIENGKVKLAHYLKSEKVWELSTDFHLTWYVDSYHNIIGLDGVINVIDLAEGRIIWTWDIRDLGAHESRNKIRKGKLTGKIRSWKDNFIFPVSGPKSAQMYSKRKSDGNTNWIQKKMIWGDFGIYNENAIAIRSHLFQEIDLNTGKILRENTLPFDHKRYWSTIFRGTVTDDRIFIYDCRQYTIFIIDYCNLELLEEYTLEKTSKESWQIGDLAVSDGKIYIKEYMKKGGTVHVLEYNV